jgi:hypothetical protein
MFQKFYEINKMRISHLFREIAGGRYEKDPTMNIEKHTDIYKTRKD